MRPYWRGEVLWRNGVLFGVRRVAAQTIQVVPMRRLPGGKVQTPAYLHKHVKIGDAQRLYVRLFDPESQEAELLARDLQEQWRMDDEAAEQGRWLAEPPRGRRWNLVASPHADYIARWLSPEVGTREWLELTLRAPDQKEMT